MNSFTLTQSGFSQYPGSQLNKKKQTVEDKDACLY